MAPRIGKGPVTLLRGAPITVVIYMQKREYDPALDGRVAALSFANGNFTCAQWRHREATLIPETGHFALTLALFVAIFQSVVPVVGASLRNARWMQTADATAKVQFVLIGIAFGALMWSFVVGDYSVLNVVENSHSLKPILYKVAATWGSHEGSLLLWVLILAAFGAAVAIRGANLPASLKARTLSVQAWITVGFVSFMLLTSNPFERLASPPLNGQDLNPLLQDIGLALHPPLLYLGYVGFSIVFSFAVAALLEGRVDAAWARWVRPWTLAAWIFLTAGIALGAWWAYYELGWGGWWFWDPVENVSFMPWLLGTALLHSAIVTEKRGTFQSWTVLLAILTFSLSLMGTFIVRSGLLTSVHAFAVDPERGIYILAMFGVTVVGSLSLFAWRAPQMEGGGLFAPISREAGLLLNNLFLSVGAAVVLIGTLYPLFLEAVSGEKISVGPPFFNSSFVPLSLGLLFVMGVGPHLSWKRADLRGIVSRLRAVALLALLGGLAVWYIQTGGPAMAVLAIVGAVWLGLSTLLEWGRRVKLFDCSLGDTVRRIRSQPRAAHGMTVAHLGLAVCVIGFVGSSAWKQEIVAFAETGDTFEIANYSLELRGVTNVTGPNYTAQRAILQVWRNDKTVTVLTPERRYYDVAEMQTTEAAIHSTLAGDLYVTLSVVERNGANEWTLRMIYEPLVGFIWGGVFLLVLGGLFSLSDRRLRIGAPRQSVKPAGIAKVSA
jgi:cytochrome c-type biogenesis protein CcmF